ncbi:MAG: hypothetical protein R3E83_04080 [Burkholderiaceae bacterium]
MKIERNADRHRDQHQDRRQGSRDRPVSVVGGAAPGQFRGQGVDQFGAGIIGGGGIEPAAALFFVDLGPAVPQHAQARLAIGVAAGAAVCERHRGDRRR